MNQLFGPTSCHPTALHSWVLTPDKWLVENINQSNVGAFSPGKAGDHPLQNLNKLFNENNFDDRNIF
ncbi:hypothetical protein CFREI_09850 [Corynebacterium freiburgense]|nr:hypothetical protein CFREI_09850 [Corynebacterium freiburgense]